MSGSINIPGQLMAAQAASFSKGQDVTRENAKDTKEKERLLRQMLVQKKEQEAQQKPSGTQKGILA